MPKKYDSIIVGGGVIGLSIAWELSRRGWSTAVLDRGRMGAEASRASAGMIGPQSEAMEDDAYFQATLVSRDLWPAFARDLEEASGLGFGFETRGAVHLAFGASYEKRLESRYLWQKKAAGEVKRLDRAATMARWPWLHPRVSAAFVASGDYWLDNEALMDALEKACLEGGVDVMENREVLSLKEEGDAVTGVNCVDQVIEGGTVLICAGAWSGNLLSTVEGKKNPAGIHPVKGQMLEFDVPQRLMPDLPIHAEFAYMVPRPGNRLAVGATVETVGFDKNLTGEGIEWLLQNAFETIPDLRLCAVRRLWAGLRPGAGDGWPSLGATGKRGLYVAAGHYRRGILFAPLTAQALADCLDGKGLPEAARAFSYERHTVKS